MKKYIGVLGGLGYRGTMLAYEKLNKRYQLLVGEEHTCPIRLLAIDFKEINELLPFKISEAASILLPFLRELDNQDTVCNIMINNTLHQAMDLLSSESPLETPVGHVGSLLTRYLEKEKPESTMIIGSKYTMNSGYLSTYVPDSVQIVNAKPGIQDDLETIRSTYFTHVDENLVKHSYNQLLSEYADVDVFIIACTEHSLAFSEFTGSDRWVDTMDLQCNWAVDKLV